MYPGILDGKFTSDIAQKDYVYVSTLDFEAPDFYSTPSCRALDKDRCILEEDFIDFHHPFFFSDKIQSIKHDNLTCSDVI